LRAYSTVSDLYLLQFSLQRARFGLWGESVGLVPNPEGRCLRYDTNIGREDIRPEVERILNNIKSLLQDVDQVDQRYGLKSSPGKHSDVSTSVGINIFRSSFERFKSRIKHNQKQKSTWTVTRWAIHDAAKFEVMINRLEKYVDGLEKLTDSLGRLEQRLREEIDTISDVQSLILLRDASSSHRSSSQQDVSDTASRRLTSFVTAKIRTSSVLGSLPSHDLPVPGAWPSSLMSITSAKSTYSFGQTQRPTDAFKPAPSCVECSEEHYKCTQRGYRISCYRCHSVNRSCSYDCTSVAASHSGLGAAVGSKTNHLRSEVSFQTYNLDPTDVPQNQRVVNELLHNANARKLLSFEEGDAHYGERLDKTKKADINYLLQNSANLLGQAYSGTSAAKRMFFELRNIRTGNVPFVSAVPIGDSLDKVLASIEGPPETPYAGGVFWITVRLSQNYPLGPPLMRFHTKVYHPNISPQGQICADYSEKWMSLLSAVSRSTVTDPDALWYSRKSTEIQWSLGALLTAICGLLASPDVDDPLVPEIAQQYLANYDNYCKIARDYTKRYAVQERPDDDDLLFLDDMEKNDTNRSSATSSLRTFQLEEDSVSIQLSTKGVYDEPFPGQDEAITSFVSSGTPKPNSSSSVPQSYHRTLLERHKNYPTRLLAAAVKAHLQNSIDIHGFPLDSAADSYYLSTEWLVNTIDEIREEINVVWNDKWWKPTDIDISYVILKLAILWISNELVGDRKTYHRQILRNCKLYFTSLAMNAISLRVGRSIRHFKIVFVDQSGQNWTVQGIRPIDVQELYSAIHACAEITQQLDWQKYSDPGSTDWSPTDLQRFLQDLPKTPAIKELEAYQALVVPSLIPHNDFEPTEYYTRRKRGFTTHDDWGDLTVSPIT
jgi:ubiquitin-protein ligase